MSPHFATELLLRKDTTTSILEAQILPGYKHSLLLCEVPFFWSGFLFVYVFEKGLQTASEVEEIKCFPKWRIMYVNRKCKSYLPNEPKNRYHNCQQKVEIAICKMAEAPANSSEDK